MDTIVLFTPVSYTLESLQILLPAIREFYPDPTVELKPAGDMKSFRLVLPQETWTDRDGKFFDRLLYGLDLLATWELKAG